MAFLQVFERPENQVVHTVIGSELAGGIADFSVVKHHVLFDVTRDVQPSLDCGIIVLKFTVTAIDTLLQRVAHCFEPAQDKQQIKGGLVRDLDLHILVYLSLNVKRFFKDIHEKQ